MCAEIILDCNPASSKKEKKKSDSGSTETRTPYPYAAKMDSIIQPLSQAGVSACFGGDPEPGTDRYMNALCSAAVSAAAAGTQS